MGFFDFLKQPASHDPFSKKDDKPWYIPDKNRPDSWRRDIPYNDPVDSHIWDQEDSDHDGDGYRDGSVGDADLWDE